jgi:hypothetical protein
MELRARSLARRFFENWRASLKWQRLTPYEKFAAMIDRHWDRIAAYCRPENKVSLGFVEGLNNKIRVIQRRAYGLRNEEYLPAQNPHLHVAGIVASATANPPTTLTSVRRSGIARNGVGIIALNECGTHQHRCGHDGQRKGRCLYFLSVRIMRVFERSYPGSVHLSEPIRGEYQTTWI